MLARDRRHGRGARSGLRGSARASLRPDLCRRPTVHHRLVRHAGAWHVHAGAGRHLRRGTGLACARASRARRSPDVTSAEVLVDGAVPARAMLSPAAPAAAAAMPSASRPSWARILSAEPCGMNLRRACPSTCTGTDACDGVDLVGDGHADATVAHAVLDGDARHRCAAASVIIAGSSGAQQRTSHTVASMPCGGEHVGRLSAPSATILPTARMAHAAVARRGPCGRAARRRPRARRRARAAPRG